MTLNFFHLNQLETNVHFICPLNPEKQQQNYKSNQIEKHQNEEDV